LREWYYKTLREDPDTLKAIVENLALPGWKLSDFMKDYDKQKEFSKLDEYIEMLDKCYK
jgi:hypothetical protein